jgi:hypothetical protein
MEQGDRFIFYSKTGVVKGVVSKVFNKVAYDLKNGIKVVHTYIISEDGETYNTNLCLKIDSDISPSFLRRLLSIFK